MDLVFNSLPDVFSYQSLRHTTYENPWFTESSSKGKHYPTGNKKVKDQCPSNKGNKDSCPICQERQRRPLSTYIRSKSRQDRKEDSSIEEEAEAEVEVEAPEETASTNTKLQQIKQGSNN